jgi:predicted O-linked N-acetylglucosamine transferase (SPINDLY family)
VGDRVAIPETHRPHFNEKVVYLPHTYLPNDNTKAISDRRFTRSELGLPETGFVFCCFNNAYKITPDVFEIWMRLLRRVEHSVLWLSVGDTLARAHLLQAAEARGIAAERLIFSERMPSLADHLARHQQADLFLDTFHYNAHTTASDALWAGLPVLTCLGETFAGRVAASLLQAVGLPELITRTPAEYEALALELATHPTRLTDIRSKLAANRLTYPLFDTARFTRDLEQAYVVMWDRYQAGLPADHILVGG